MSEYSLFQGLPLGTAKATISVTSADPAFLSFQAGDTITDVSIAYDSWWRGRVKSDSALGIFYAGFTVAFSPPADGRFIIWINEESGRQTLSAIWQGKISHLLISNVDGKYSLESHVSQFMSTNALFLM